MTIERVECWVFRAPIASPVKAAVGVLSNRPAVFVRVGARDGAWGWGEVFCNFPPMGAEHRARIVRELLAPMLAGQPSDDPSATWKMLDARLRRLALQAGEPGPMSQAAAAIDQALWDLCARRVGKPLWRFLLPHVGDARTADGRFMPYASGIGPAGVAETAADMRARGYKAFKFKVGFGPQQDLANFEQIRSALGATARIMVDANQAWAPDEAATRAAELQPYEPYWLEEPIAADETLADWRRLADSTAVPLAAGENVRGLADFTAALENRHLRFIQPDVGKWGGISGCLAVARQAARAGATFCPHWLGGGIGLAATMHLRAALGPDGMVEVDANPNPLREQVLPMPPMDAIGWMRLGEGAGLGFDPDLAGLEPYRVQA